MLDSMIYGDIFMGIDTYLEACRVHFKAEDRQLATQKKVELRHELFLHTHSSYRMELPKSINNDQHFESRCYSSVLRALM